LIGRGLAAALTLIIVGTALTGCQEFGQPDDVPGERLAFEEPFASVGDSVEAYSDPWVVVATTDEDLAAAIRSHEDSDLGGAELTLPSIPEAQTAVLFYAGHVDQRTSRRLEGVFNDNGSWVVVVYTVYDDDDRGGDRADFTNFPIPLLFVDAEPPQRIQIRVENSDGGEVEWAQPASIAPVG
jgi:hypothetical protein